eukprot:CAMPEP_0202908644 /NCGR_PEP_ID=MMETSP1392-20130828/46753_1 /ASSEMBLY_ACC=CAM_ASM_000868 /TAXON_ID=225041 /ORGANISM="Chlamydomonas chlamydogama, Strain SAG 11-48b" /LENGTH=48 /DNA_ID= /DNA_START= /DNA_END= /DNA_ORIENTATION=
MWRGGRNFWQAWQILLTACTSTSRSFSSASLLPPLAPASMTALSTTSS